MTRFPLSFTRDELESVDAEIREVESRCKLLEWVDLRREAKYFESLEEARRHLGGPVASY